MSYQIRCQIPRPPLEAKITFNGDVGAFRDWLEGRKTNKTEFDRGKLLINDPMMQDNPDIGSLSVLPDEILSKILAHNPDLASVSKKMQTVRWRDRGCPQATESGPSATCGTQGPVA